MNPSVHSLVDEEIQTICKTMAVLWICRIINLAIRPAVR